MPSFRLRIRTLMVAIAIAGLLIGGSLEIARWRRLRAEYQRQVAHHNSHLGYDRKLLANARKGRAIAVDAVSDSERILAEARSDDQKSYAREWRDYWAKYIEFYDREIAGIQRHADYHAELAAKYSGAFHRPWITVSPDPPEPEPDEISLSMGWPSPPRMRFDIQ